jgi:hypothetical protein
VANTGSPCSPPIAETPFPRAKHSQMPDDQVENPLVNKRKFLSRDGLADVLDTQFTRSRLGFTLLSFATAAFFPVGLMVLLPFASPNSAVRAWTLADSLSLAVSIVAGPFACASPTPSNWVMAALLVPSCLAYALHPTRLAAGITAVGMNVWMWCGLILTFVDV